MKHILPLVKTFFIGKQKWEIPYWSSIENRRDLQEQFKETRKKNKKKEKKNPKAFSYGSINEKYFLFVRRITLANSRS